MLDNKTILIVEDEAMIACDLEDVVTCFGGVVGALCLDMDTAIAEAGAGTFDVAILDYNVGGRTVDPVAEILRARGIPFVFNTAIGERADLQNRYGHVEVCRKPVTDQELVSALNRALVG